jgi:DNA-nicking Smr family endonuclease
MASKDDRSLFREAVRGVAPLKEKPRAELGKRRPPAVPVRSLLDEHAALRESAQRAASIDDAPDSGEDESFLRPGLPRDVLRKLRRGHWGVQGETDLHGLNVDQAREQVATFLNACGRRGVRCARIVHGKGLRSPNREPVLRTRVRSWLARRDEVLAFCQAPANQGGGGALLVLLKDRGTGQGR